MIDEKRRIKIISFSLCMVLVATLAAFLSLLFAKSEKPGYPGMFPTLLVVMISITMPLLIMTSKAARIVACGIAVKDETKNNKKTAIGLALAGIFTGVAVVCYGQKVYSKLDGLNLVDKNVVVFVIILSVVAVFLFLIALALGAQRVHGVAVFAFSALSGTASLIALLAVPSFFYNKVLILLGFLWFMIMICLLEGWMIIEKRQLARINPQGEATGCRKLRFPVRLLHSTGFVAYGLSLAPVIVYVYFILNNFLESEDWKDYGFGLYLINYLTVGLVIWLAVIALIYIIVSSILKKIIDGLTEGANNKK